MFSKKIIAIMNQKGQFFKSGYDGPDGFVNDPLRADGVEDLLYYDDANVYVPSGCRLVEVKVTCHLTGREDLDLYHKDENDNNRLVVNDDVFEEFVW